MRTSLRIATLATSLALGACGVSPAMVENLRRQNARDRLELEATKASVLSLEAYAASLRGGTLAPGGYLMVTAPDLQRWAPAFLPYSMHASEVLSGATGTVVVKEVAGVRFLPRNRMAMRLFFQGQNIGYSKQVPKAYAQDVQRVKEAVASGVWADLEVSLAWRKENSAVVAQATCTGVTLTRHNQPTYRSELQKYINQRMLNRPFNTLVPALEGRKAEAMFATQHHVVFAYP